MKIQSQHCFDILLGTLIENVNSLGIVKIVSIIKKMLWYDKLWEKLSTVFCINATILLLFSYKLCIKSPFRAYVQVYINLLCVDSDYLTKENASEGIYDAVLNLKWAEAFAVFLGDLPSYGLLLTEYSPNIGFRWRKGSSFTMPKLWIGVVARFSAF